MLHAGFEGALVWAKANIPMLPVGAAGVGDGVGAGVPSEGTLALSAPLLLPVLLRPRPPLLVEGCELFVNRPKAIGSVPRAVADGAPNNGAGAVGVTPKLNVAAGCAAPPIDR